jgi:RNA polymerase sigma-70 factor (ECF subfamily)
MRWPVLIRPPVPPTEAEFAELLGQARQFLLGVANAELPAALRAKGGASDLVQETFAAALRGRHQFRGTTLDDLRAWLRAILRNELATFHRRFAAAAARDVGREVPAGTASNLPAVTPPPIERLIRDEQARTLAATVAGLPDDQREVVVLRLEHGLPFTAVGERLGRSEEAARKLFSRALERLRGVVPDPAD